MRRFLAVALAALAFVITWLIAAVAGPDRMPTHFGLDGPDRWGTRGQFLLVSGIGGVIAAVLVVLAVNARRLPPGLINTPHREYWLGSHRDEFDAIMASLLTAIATLLFVVFSVTNITAVWWQNAPAVHSGILIVLVIAILVTVGVKVLRLYTEPRGRTTGG